MKETFETKNLSKCVWAHPTSESLLQKIFRQKTFRCVVGFIFCAFLVISD